MALVNFEARNGLRRCLLSFAATAAALTIASDAADARYYRHVHYVHVSRTRHHQEEYSPPYASIVVDGNSGSVLQATNPDAPRHPASLTKVMTLYLLFERLDAGKIKLDTALNVSEHASDQDPTKLDLKPGQTITVEDAIKGVVTKSANDAAVVIAENLGSSEDAFAKLMTQTAHAIGMAHTTYVNASGLPNDDQLTTARDQALLGRAIQDRFPHYYKYFSTETFVFHGSAMRNHNHLLGEVEGVDGIKTGFTRASGFNLLTSVHRDGRYIVAVVLGGPSASDRDDRMRDLIGEHLKEASLHRTAPQIVEAPLPHEETQQTAAVKPPAAAVTPHADPATTATVDAHANDPIKPLLVKTITYRTAPVQTASLAPMPALVAVAAPVAPPAPQPAVSQPTPQQAQAVEQPRTPIAAVPVVAPVTAAKVEPVAPVAANPAVIAKIEAPVKPEVVAAAPITPTPPSAAPTPPAAKASPPAPPAPAPVASIPAAPPAPAHVASIPAPPPAVKPPAPEPAEAETAAPDHLAYAEPEKAEPAIASAIPAHARGGWLIQIGAFDDEDQAKQHLSAAQTKLSTALKADPFTERIQKGDKALYRARFAGFDRATAEAACKQLKRSDFDCMALKD
jgi:D-alanyl-D-alanine carboxypeptidase